MCSHAKISLSSIEEVDDDDQAYLLASHMSVSFMLPAVLKASLDLNLFDIIAREPMTMMSPSQIASHLPTSQYPNLPHKLDRMLRFLATHSFLTCSLRGDEHGNVERLYGLSPAAKYFVLDRDGNTNTMASSFSMFSFPVFADVWLNYKEAILDEEVDLFKKIHGESMYQHLEKDPKLNKIFHTSIANLSTIQMKKVLEAYKGFEGISTLVDVGGGNGLSLNMILSKYPSIKAINFDLPQVIQNAPSYPGIEHVGGDMLKNIPKGSDAIMLKCVCHNWEDEACLQILRNCQKALPEKGKVIVIDMIIAEAAETSIAAKYVSSLDNLMFFQPGGRERTIQEFESLSKSSGFSSFHLVSTAFSVLGVMEFHK